jgi:hypothetical protein
MPRRKRPATTERSEHWLRFAIGERTESFNDRVKVLFGWPCPRQRGNDLQRILGHS